jgi:hypothetical protein
VHISSLRAIRAADHIRSAAKVIYVGKMDNSYEMKMSVNFLILKMDFYNRDFSWDTVLNSILKITVCSVLPLVQAPFPTHVLTARFRRLLPALTDRAHYGDHLLAGPIGQLQKNPHSCSKSNLLPTCSWHALWHPTPKQGWSVLTRIRTRCQHRSIDA